MFSYTLIVVEDKHFSFPEIQSGIQALATQAANSCMRELYSSGVWLRPSKAREVVTHGMRFLQGYNRLAMMAYHFRCRRFPLLPKLHFFHHLMVDMWMEASASNWVLSPLVFSVQLQEDYIGKPSRVSRRVSPKLHALRTMQRVLRAMFAEFQRLES